MRFFAFLVLVFTSATIHAREAWRFLPCFGKDVRGIERHAAEGHFYSELPTQAPHLLTPYRNYMAVHVWSLWGLGGIVGPPVLKAALAPRDGAWEVAFAEDVAAFARAGGAA